MSTCFRILRITLSATRCGLVLPTPTGNSCHLTFAFSRSEPAFVPSTAEAIPIAVPATPCSLWANASTWSYWPPIPNKAIGSRLTFITGLMEPKLFGWMIATEEIEALAQRLKSTGDLALAVVPGSRLRPDGQRMAWRIALVNLPDVFTGLIQWHPQTHHHGTDSPTGCSLRHFSTRHPDPV